MNKKILSYIFAIAVAVTIILLVQPMMDDYKEKNQYDFTVTTIDGELKKDDFKGKAFAIYFGYMYCPDVCPTSLSSLATALKTFDDSRLENFKGLFISVDPERDTLKNLKEYSEYFHPTFLGATSNKENIDNITKNYGTYYEMVSLENSAMGYSVSHTSYIYIFDKEGNFVSKVDHFANPTQIKEVLEKVL